MMVKSLVVAHSLEESKAKREQCIGLNAPSPRVQQIQILQQNPIQHNNNNNYNRNMNIMGLPRNS